MNGAHGNGKSQYGDSGFARMTTLRRLRQNDDSQALRSATVWIVKSGLMEERKTEDLFSSFPQPRLGLRDN